MRASPREAAERSRGHPKPHGETISKASLNRAGNDLELPDPREKTPRGRLPSDQPAPDMLRARGGGIPGSQNWCPWRPRGDRRFWTREEERGGDFASPALSKSIIASLYSMSRIIFEKNNSLFPSFKKCQFDLEMARFYAKTNHFRHELAFSPTHRAISGTNWHSAA